LPMVRFFRCPEGINGKGTWKHKRAPDRKGDSNKKFLVEERKEPEVLPGGGREKKVDGNPGQKAFDLSGKLLKKGKFFPRSWAMAEGRWDGKTH